MYDWNGRVTAKENILMDLTDMYTVLSCDHDSNISSLKLYHIS